MIAALVFIMNSLNIGAEAQQRNTAHSDLPSTPEALVAQYVKAISDGNWDRMAHLVDPDIISGMQQILIAATEKCKAGEALKFELGLGLSEISAMEPQEFLTLLLEVMDARHPGELITVSSPNVEIIGVIEEDDLRHVVYRFKTSEKVIQYTRVQLLTARKVSGGWVANLLDDLQGALVSFQLSLEECIGA